MLALKDQTGMDKSQRSSVTASCSTREVQVPEQLAAPVEVKDHAMQHGRQDVKQIEAAALHGSSVTRAKLRQRQRHVPVMCL